MKRDILLVLGLVIAVTLVSDNLYHAIYLDLANLALVRWGLAPWQARSERSLSAAVQWGERAGVAWTERYGHGERAQTLWENVKKDAMVARQHAEAYQQAQALEDAGKLELALLAYQQAFIGDRQWIEAGYKVYCLAQQTGQVDLMQRQAQAMRNLVPEYLVTATLANGTRLLGYDLDETSLDRDDGTVPITLYWELAVPLDTVAKWQVGGYTYIGVRDRLYQIGAVDNLLPNGGFEHDLSTLPALPFGYHSIFYGVRNRLDYNQTHYRLVEDERDGEVTQAVAVNNPNQGLDGITTRHKITVEPGALYSLSGWMRTTGDGIGYLGGVWRTNNDQDVLYWYAAKRQTVPSWQRFVSALLAPIGAKSFVPLALNQGAGEVYFDNLMFFQVPIPPEPASEQGCDIIR